MNESQTSINSWQNLTFPASSPSGIHNHLLEEFEEFRRAQTIDEKFQEAADIIILLYAYAGKHGVDIHDFVDKKMQINRERQWNIQPDGTGRHT